MDSLILVEWTRKPGELVTKGEILFLVETDKATLEVEAPATGILQEVLAQPGAEVKVRSKIASLLAPDEIVPPQPAPPSAAPVPAGTSPAAAVQPLGERRSEPILPAGRQGRILASPRARRLATADAVDLRELQATGPRGMIVSRDVLAYLAERRRRARITPLAQRVADDLGLDLAGLAAGRPGQVITRAEVEALGEGSHAYAGAEPAAAAPNAPLPALAQESSTPMTQATGTAGVATTTAPAGRRVVLSNLRRTIAQRLQESHQTTAPVTLTREVNVTQLTEVRGHIVRDLPPGAARPSLTDFLAFILARCLVAHPALNGVASGDTWELADEVHLSLAVDTDRGLLVPVIRSAQRKGLLALAEERTDLVERTRSGSVRPEELSGGTFTLTNLGPLGVDAFTPIINPPQIAILGLGRIRTVPSFVSGQVVPAEMMVLSLTFDHRVVDGAPAARLLQDLALWIEKPHLIWLR
jgi:pyruvate dehydrogenase E2 component (dihydrolipoamide acetyltransferase)